MYRIDVLYPGFDKYVLDIPLADGRIIRTATHVFTALEPAGTLPHNHPFDIESDVREGEYIEEIYIPVPGGYWRRERWHRRKGDKIFIKAGTIHKIIDFPTGLCITQVIG